MKPQQIEIWKLTRERGRLRYVLVNGVLLCGLPLFVAMTFVLARHDLDWTLIGLYAVLSALGGAALGTAMWLFQESEFRMAVATEPLLARRGALYLVVAGIFGIAIGLYGVATGLGLVSGEPVSFHSITTAFFGAVFTALSVYIVRRGRSVQRQLQSTSTHGAQ